MCQMFFFFRVLVGVLGVVCARANGCGWVGGGGFVVATGEHLVLG